MAKRFVVEVVVEGVSLETFFFNCSIDGTYISSQRPDGKKLRKFSCRDSDTLLKHALTTLCAGGQHHCGSALAVLTHAIDGPCQWAFGAISFWTVFPRNSVCPEQEGAVTR